MKIILTGGAGFIGSSVIRSLLQKPDIEVINVDCLTYAGNLDSLDSISSSNRYTHEEIDICDKSSITHLVAKHKPDAVMHLAAESHVDRSIEEPNIFIDTNTSFISMVATICKNTKSIFVRIRNQTNI